MKSLIILLAIVIEYSSAQSTVALYGQCGGWDSAKNAAWTLPCDSGLVCQYQNQYYSQCLTATSATGQNVALYGQCGGWDSTKNAAWTLTCVSGSTCVYQNQYYSQCLPSQQSSTLPATQASTQASTQAPTQASTQAGLPIMSIYEQCGGWDNLNNKPWSYPCEAGTTCVYQSQYYSQCLPTQGSTVGSTPATAQSTTQGSTQSTTQGSTQPTTTGSTGGSPSCPSFIKGQFRLGISYDKATGLSTSDLSNYDYVSLWLGTVTMDGTNSTDFNVYYQGAMLEFCLKNNKIPLFYGYIIAFEARHKMGLQDCDVSITWNLCTNGSEFIRNNRQYLVDRYAYHAGKVASYVGRTATVIFVMEPDFWQYYGDDGTNGKPFQFGGALSGAYMRALFDDFVLAIRSQLPNAIISWDISAWIGQSGFSTWWSFFSTADIQFIHTSGGQARGDLAEIKPNELTWKFVSQTTGRKIIADCGYGVAGALGSTCAPWTDQYTYQFDRVNDGVVALSVANPVGNYRHVPVNC